MPGQEDRVEEERKRDGKSSAVSALKAERGLSEQETLAFLLRTVNPKIDAETVARRLLERFERLADIFEAPEQVLRREPELDGKTAALLAAFPDIFRVYLESKHSIRARITDTGVAFHTVRSKFFGQKREIVVLLILDSKGYLKYMDVINEGSVRGVPLYIRELLALCLAYDADTVYLAHNHPSGNCTPSTRDIQSTKEIDMVLESVGIHLADHFIFTDEDYVSMRASGILQKQRNDWMMQKKRFLTP